MTDRREAILARLVAIGEGLPASFATVGRNLADLPMDDAGILPALIVMDGDEEIDPDAGPLRTGRGRTSDPAPSIMRMTPSLHVILSGAAAELGPDMNAARADLIRAVLTDMSLQGLCHDGRMAYGACVTGILGEGATLVAEIGLSFHFNYVLVPSEL